MFKLPLIVTIPDDKPVEVRSVFDTIERVRTHVISAFALSIFIITVSAAILFMSDVPYKAHFQIGFAALLVLSVIDLNLCLKQLKKYIEYTLQYRNVPHKERLERDFHETLLDVRPFGKDGSKYTPLMGCLFLMFGSLLGGLVLVPLLLFIVSIAYLYIAVRILDSSHLTALHACALSPQTGKAKGTILSQAKYDAMWKARSSRVNK